MAYDASVSGGKGVTVEQVKKMGESLRDAGYAYEHPTQQAMLGEPTSNQTPSFGGTFTVSQISSDLQGHVSGLVDRTIRIPDSLATASAKGLMSAADKVRLDGLNQGAVPEGKELTKSWQDLMYQAQAKDYSGIHIGDFKPITLTTGEVVIMEVGGIGQYTGCGSIEIGGHIDFISRDCLAGGKRMNATNTNNGTEAEKHPWLASELYQTLNDETTGVYATLPADLKPYIIGKIAAIEERYSSGGNVSSDTGVSFANIGKLWLPTEIEVVGASIRSDPMYGAGGSGCNTQYPIFAHSTKHRIKRSGNGGSRCSWFLMSVHKLDSAGFCVIVYNSGITNADANILLNIPLCFRIG